MPLFLRPSDLPDGSASEHLEALLDAAADAVQSLPQQPTACCATTSTRPDMSLPLTLVGFSKGSVVLNQLVTELACETPQEAVPPKTERVRHSSKRSDSCEDSDGARMTNDRKRSRVSQHSNSTQAGDGSGHFANSELDGDGDVTNPPSPAEDADDASTSWPMVWESRQDGEKEGGEGRQGGAPRASPLNGNVSHQVRPQTVVKQLLGKAAAAVFRLGSTRWSCFSWHRLSCWSC